MSPRRAPKQRRNITKNSDVHVQTNTTVSPSPVSAPNQLPLSLNLRLPASKRIESCCRCGCVNPETLPKTTDIESPAGAVVIAARSPEEKRQFIKKQLVILLHAILCRRRDLNNISRVPGAGAGPCNVPFCGLMKAVLAHAGSCKAGRSCGTIHCLSSRQILIHWKYCVKPDCSVCVSVRQAVPASLLSIFPTPLNRAEINRRIARQRELQPQVVPDPERCELMDSEE